MKKRKFLLPLLLAYSILSLTACKENSSEIEEAESFANESLEDFKYTEDTKVFLTINDEKKEITEYVTNYKNGEVYVTPQFLENVMDMKPAEMTEDEIADFENAEKENGLKSSSDLEFIKFQNEEHTIILRAGSKLFSHNGLYSMLGSSVVKTEDGRYSCILTDIIINLGYNNIGTSVRNNQILNTVY